MRIMKSLMLAAALAGACGTAAAQEQYVPLLSYRVGPYAAGGTGFYGGVIDYFNLVNMNGGINGVKLTWEECETEYNASRGVECYERLKTRNGGASLVEPLSTGIAYGILDRVAVDLGDAGATLLGRADVVHPTLVDELGHQVRHGHLGDAHLAGQLGPAGGPEAAQGLQHERQVLTTAVRGEDCCRGPDAARHCAGHEG